MREPNTIFAELLATGLAPEQVALIAEYGQASVAALAMPSESVEDRKKRLTRERTQAWRERHKTSPSVTGASRPDSVTERHETSPERHIASQPRAHVRDITPTTEISGGYTSERGIADGCDAGADLVWPPSQPPRKPELDTLEAVLRAEASPGIDQTATSICVLSPILSLANPSQGPPCDLYADVLPVIRGKSKSAKPGSIRTWAFFVPACIEARDRRLQDLPNVETLDARRTSRPDAATAKRLAREANYARSFNAPSRVAER